MKFKSDLVDEFVVHQVLSQIIHLFDTPPLVAVCQLL